MNPWSLLASAVLFAICLAGGYKWGYTASTNAQAQAQLQKEREFQRSYADLVAKNNELASQLEQAKNERKTVYRTITKNVDRIVESPVYQRECIDAAGLSSANSALAGKVAPTP